MATPFTNTTGNAIIGTSEFSLVNASTTPASLTTLGGLEGWLDLSALAAGDQYRIRIYEKVDGGSQLPAFEAFVTGAQPLLYTLPRRLLADGWDVRVTKIAGTDRSIRWALRLDVGDRNALTVAAAAIGASQLAAGTITAAKFAANAIDATALAADAVAEIQTGLATSAALAAVAAAIAGLASASAAAVWATVTEGSETAIQTVRLLAARLIGKATVQDGDGSYTFRDAADTKNRLVMVRAGSARTVTTRDGT